MNHRTLRHRAAGAAALSGIVVLGVTLGDAAIAPRHPLIGRGGLPVNSPWVRAHAHDTGSRQMNTVVEFRSYNLTPGTRERFHQRVVEEAVPMLRRWNIDVVAFGPSLHDADSYFLIRAFPSLEDRQEREDAFYGSQEWVRGPRAAILADIESYTTVVVLLDEVSVHNIRTTVGRTARDRPRMPH